MIINQTEEINNLEQHDYNEEDASNDLSMKNLRSAIGKQTIRKPLT